MSLENIDGMEKGTAYNTTGGQKYSEEEVYKQFRKAADKYGENFTANDFKQDNDFMSLPTARKLTDMNFNEIKRKLGFKVNYNITKEDVYNDFKKAAEIYGESFTREQFDNDNNVMTRRPAENIIGKSFNEIKKELEYEINEDYSKEEVIKQFNMAAEKYGKNFTTKQFEDDNDFMSVATAKRIMNINFNDIKLKLDLKINNERVHPDGNELKDIKDKVEAVKRGYEINNNQIFSANEWNENIRYELGIATSYNILTKHHSISELYTRAGLMPLNNRIDWNEKLINAVLIIADNFLNQPITAEWLKNTKWTPAYVTIKSVTDNTLNEQKQELDIDVNHQKYDKNEIIKQLNKIIDNDGYPITHDKIKNHCTFNPSLISSRFGHGSFIDGLKNLGFKIYDEQLNRSIIKSESYTNLARNMIIKRDDYLENADAYLYRLKCRRQSDSEIHYYCGSVRKNKSLISRIKNHLSANGDFKGMNQRGYLDRNVKYDINIDKIICLYMDEKPSLIDEYQFIITKEKKLYDKTVLKFKDAEVFGI